MDQTKSVVENVKEYYGEILGSSEDLKTSACCPISTMPTHLNAMLENIHEKIRDKFYGCGSPVPFDLEGKTVLDLGCGTGRDVYLMSQLVGPSGHVIGVDMTPNQLHVAQNHLDYHMNKFGFTKPNVTFHHGLIEDLSSAGIADASIDLVTSNCVINLSTEKKKVFREIFRVLKPGGELFFSDVYAGRRIPQELAKDPVMVGECLGGALYLEDFRRIMAQVGFSDYRVVEQGPIELEDAELKDKAGMIDFHSLSIRSFKGDFEDGQEDFGHKAIYAGTITGCESCFVLDQQNRFTKGEAVSVSGNTAKILSESRYARHFELEGDFSVHMGPFDPGVFELRKSASSCC